MVLDYALDHMPALLLLISIAALAVLGASRLWIAMKRRVGRRR